VTEWSEGVLSVTVDEFSGQVLCGDGSAGLLKVVGGHMVGRGAGLGSCSA
jgi:hypothetical protein